MFKGSTVIFNEDYIEEITRHRDIWQQKFDVENIPELKERTLKELQKWEDKLEWSLNFRDIVDFVQNMEIPQITVVKTLNGYEIPAKHLQVI